MPCEPTTQGTYVSPLARQCAYWKANAPTRAQGNRSRTIHRFGMAGHLERLLENRVPEAWLFNQS